MTKRKFIKVLEEEGYPNNLAQSLWDRLPGDATNEGRLRLTCRHMKASLIALALGSIN